MKYYLRMEGVNLSNFVYDTQDLSTVRGGGLLLLDAVDRVEKYLKTEKIATSVTPITTGASSGLFEFVAEDGEKVRGKIEDFLNADLQLKHATFMVDVIEAGKGDEFSDKKEKLIAMNRWRQMQSPSLAVPSAETNRYKPCTIDLVRPSKHDVFDKDGKLIDTLSESVKQRRDYGTSQKRGDFYTTGLRASLSTYRNAEEITQKELFKEAETNAAGLQNTPPQFTNNLDELSSNKDFGNLHNKIAVIYADGNSFGKLQQKFDKDTQKRFDLLLKAYRSSFLLKLLAKMQHDDNWKNVDKYRIETLLWGGDEFMLVVPAWKGWETLQLFYEVSGRDQNGDPQQPTKWYFKYKQKGTEITRDLTHSAGLVFCHHNAPIHRIKTLAHDLAETCKNLEKDNFCKNSEEWDEQFPTGPKGNYFAFQVLESFDNIHGDLAEYRQKICPPRTHHGALMIDGDGNNMEKIREAIQTIKGDEKMSRGRLHGIVKDLVAGKNDDSTRNIQKLTDSIGSETITKLNELKNLFNGDKARWLQLSELWDYAYVERRP